MSNRSFWLVALAFCIVILCGVFAITNNWGGKVRDYIRGNEVVEQKKVNEVAKTVTFTIQDVLDMREQEKEYRILDSVFLNMPEIPLIAILMKGGTDMSHSDIAKEYLQNKKNYDDVEFGAQISEAYKHSVKDPDEIPRKTEPDTVLPNQ